MGGFGVILRRKIAREIIRASQRIKAVVGLIWEPFVQRRYDRNRDSRLSITVGRRPLRERVVIYLIYQPGQILASTLETCRALEDQGYATLIVSNAPLEPTAMAQLQEVAWQVIQRPNYGYDFGGYRDGILYLLDKGLMPQWLMVMNDSVWYPLGRVDTLVRRLEGSGLDVAGTIVHRSFRKTLLRRTATRVIESYLFLFNRTALESQAFRDFWQRYRVSSNKQNAVRRGERRLAEYMLAAGLKADGIFAQDAFMTHIVEQPDDFLRKTLAYAAYTDHAFEAERDKLLAERSGATAWRGRVLDHISRVSAHRSFHGSFVFASLQLMDLCLLKKAAGRGTAKYGNLHTKTQEQYLSAVSAGDLPAPSDAILAEIGAFQQRIGK